MDTSFWLIYMSGLNRSIDLLDDAMVTTLYLGLIDILFGYAYTVRTNEGEDNVSHNLLNINVCILSILKLR